MSLITNKIAENIADSISLSTGLRETITSFFEYFFGDFNKHMRIVRLARDAEVESIKKSLFSDISKIDKDNLQNPIGTPEESILLTTFKAYPEYANSKHYQKLFNSLITSTFDKSKYCDLHPSFPFIIQQLTPLDAKILIDISKQKQSVTFGYFYGYGQKSNGSFAYSDSFDDFYLIKNENGEYEDIELTNISINNLCKLGLIRLKNIDKENPYNGVPVDSDDFHDVLNKATKGLELGQGGGAVGAISYVSLSRLGKSFMRTCMSD